MIKTIKRHSISQRFLLILLFIKFKFAHIEVILSNNDTMKDRSVLC